MKDNTCAPGAPCIESFLIGARSVNDGAAMCEGYIGLTLLLAGKKGKGRKQFTKSIEDLKKLGTDDAKFYAKQLTDVRKYFTESGK